MEQSYYRGIDAEALVTELEERINRIAADLAEETGRPLQEWLVTVSRLLAPSLRYAIREIDGMHVYVIDRAEGKRPALGRRTGAALG
jgi:hypothetical protein